MQEARSYINFIQMEGTYRVLKLKKTFRFGCNNFFLPIEMQMLINAIYR